MRRSSVPSYAFSERLFPSVSPHCRQPRRTGVLLMTHPSCLSHPTARRSKSPHPTVDLRSKASPPSAETYLPLDLPRGVKTQIFERFGERCCDSVASRRQQQSGTTTRCIHGSGGGVRLRMEIDQEAVEEVRGSVCSWSYGAGPVHQPQGQERSCSATATTRRSCPTWGKTGLLVRGHQSPSGTISRTTRGPRVTQRSRR